MAWLADEPRVRSTAESSPQFLVAMSFRHLANWRPGETRQLGEASTTQHLHMHLERLESLFAALPSSLSIVQQLSLGAAGALCFRRG